MDSPPPSLQSIDSRNPMDEFPPPSNGRNSINKKMNKKKKKKSLAIDASDQQSSSNSISSSSSSLSCTMSHSARRGGFHVSNNKNRNRRKSLIGSVRQRESDIVEALALPLGMSLAAVLSQVLEKQDTARDRMSVDHLSKICTLAVGESLVSVFGYKFDCFVSNFEKSFRSTLMTLRLVNESSQRNGGQDLKILNKESCSDLASSTMSFEGEGDHIFHSNVENSETEANWSTISNEVNVQPDLMNRELSLHGGQSNQQLARVSPNRLPSIMGGSMLNTFERSIKEQARSNDLKTFEIGLIMKKMQQKERQLSLGSDSNILERFKLSMGISKASFKAEKFKHKLEDTRYVELLRTCVDCLVAGLLIMLGGLGYGTYVYSRQRITEATAACTPTEESKSWWVPKPMASINSGLLILRCQLQVLTRMLFGVLMILAIAYLLLQRSGTSNRTMPVTFVLLLLGVACGFAGKICIDTLGGSGYHWLFYWEALCSLHFFSNNFTPTLFIILNGPITVTERSKGSRIFPFWMRRLLFYATVLLFLPLLCGFMPFAGPSEWRDHFSSLIFDLQAKES